MHLVLHLGVWGLTRVLVTLLLASATVCNRLQPFATVCNRLQPFATVCDRPQPSATVCNRLQPSVCDRRGRKIAVPMGKVAKT